MPQPNDKMPKKYSEQPTKADSLGPTLNVTARKTIALALQIIKPAHKKRANPQ